MASMTSSLADDNGQHLYRLATLYPLPEFVKDASSNELFGDNELSELSWGDPVRKQLPGHTKAATWFSLASLWLGDLDLAPNEVSTAEERLLKLAEFHGLDGIASLKEQLRTKPAAIDYALTVTYPDGTVTQRYPLRNEEEVKTAASYLKKYRDVIPYSEKQSMAEVILTKAASFNMTWEVDQEIFLEQQAGRGTCAAADAAAFLEDRAAFLQRKDADVSKLLKSAATECRKSPATVRSPLALQKLATLVDRMDREFGLAKDYDEGITRPEEVLFAVTTKTAAVVEAEHIPTTTGNVYRTNDLGRLNLCAVRDVFGNSGAAAISAGGLVISPEKAAEVLSTLPRSDMTLMDRLLAESGVYPVAKEAGAGGGWLDNAALRKLAN